MSIVFNNAVSAAMASLWAAWSLRSSEIMTADASEVSVLEIIWGGGGLVTANREACLDTGHSGVIF